MTLGIVGGGQLGRMLAEAAKKLGVDCVVLDPTPECPASAFARHIVGDFTNHDAVMALAKECDAMTFEIESANAEALAELAAQGFPVHPTPATLSLIKDKLRQKEFLAERGIPVAPFRRVANVEEARAAGATLGYPFVLKARSGGYDGRGNATVRVESDIEDAMARLGNNLYAEGWVPFEKELAVVAVRSQGGDIRAYPVVETIHEDHICATVLAPAPVNELIAEKARALAKRILGAFEGAGVFGIELFLADGEVLVNEIAPRVHNSGHFTMDACAVSQFENHVRAVCGMELGETSMSVPAAVMVNILGQRSGPAAPSGIAEAEAQGARVHFYDKKETKPKRKMGHLNATGATLEEALAKATASRARVSI